MHQVRVLGLCDDEALCQPARAGQHLVRAGHPAAAELTGASAQQPLAWASIRLPFTTQAPVRAPVERT